jgi:hypothetical protein
MNEVTYEKLVSSQRIKIALFVCLAVIFGCFVGYKQHG